MSKDTIHITAHIYPYKKFFHLGWIVKRFEPAPIPYYSDNPYITINTESRLCYVTIGLTEKGVFNRLKKKSIEIAEEYRNGKEESGQNDGDQ